MSTYNGAMSNISNVKESLLKSVDNVLVVFIVFKLMRMGLAYAALLIARNFTTQIYMDKVLVNDENPPHLKNLVYLYLIIDVITAVISIIIIMTLNATFNLKMVFGSTNIFTQYLIPDVFINTLVTYAIGTMLANKMYDKKYFLYKDDGLRAIRALTDIMINISFILNLIPFNFIFKGIYSLIKSM